MEYTDYLREIDRAADATGGAVVSLAGGYFGLQIPAEGADVVLALDLDGDQGWVAWAEDLDGERCCDAAEELVGHSDLADLRGRALASVARHVRGQVRCSAGPTPGDWPLSPNHCVIGVMSDISLARRTPESQSCHSVLIDR